MWIIIGFLFIAIGNIMIYRGNMLTSQKNADRIIQQVKTSEKNLKEAIEEVRKTAEGQLGQNVVAVFHGDLNVGELNFSKFVIVPPRTEATNSSAVAKIIFTIPEFEIKDSKNVSGITDNGLGDISIVFDEDFPTRDYLVNISGDKTIDYKILAQEKGYIRVKFEEENLKRVQIECRKI